MRAYISKRVNQGLSATRFAPLLVLVIGLLSAMVSSISYSAEMYKVGLATWSGYPESVRGFKDGLAEGGFVEGKDIEFLQGEKGADKDLQRQVAEGFKYAGVDLVYSLTTPGTTIVKEVMPPETPIVFSIVTYPADSGLIESYEYSGNNLVGTSNYVPLRQYIKLLQVTMPTARSVAIFHRKGEPNSKIQAASMIRLLKRAGIKAIDREPANVNQVREMALALVGKADVLMTTTDTLMQNGGEEALIEISLKNGIPLLSSNKVGIEQGSSFGPVADFYTLGKMAGKKAVQILREKTAPSSIESELQEPPLFLANRNSLNALGIQLSEEAVSMIHWVE